MRLLIQRVKQASVTVNGQVTGQIGAGLLVFIGIHRDDTPDKTLWLAKKLIGMRIFKDDQDKMNLSIEDIGGKLLVISQFTLYGNCLSGKRPDFLESALPEPAFLLYEKFISELKELSHLEVHTGIFGAAMEVSLINDGPVTFILEK